MGAGQKNPSRIDPKGASVPCAVIVDTASGAVSRGKSKKSGQVQIRYEGDPGLKNGQTDSERGRCSKVSGLHCKNKHLDTNPGSKATKDPRFGVHRCNPNLESCITWLPGLVSRCLFLQWRPDTLLHLALSESVCLYFDPTSPAYRICTRPEFLL